jgi:hypothetical protein
MRTPWRGFTDSTDFRGGDKGMRLLSMTKGGSTVSRALDRVIEELNKELCRTDGLINKVVCDVHAGPAGASVTVSLIVNGYEPRKKQVLGVNVKGINRETSMKKATEKLNHMLKDINGELVDVFVKTVVAPLPGRVYTTIVAAVNERLLTEAWNSSLRRQRIKRALELFNDNPSAINVAGVAAIFGVSRTIIYKDLEALGFKRGK